MDHLFIVFNPIVRYPFLQSGQLLKKNLGRVQVIKKRTIFLIEIGKKIKKKSYDDDEVDNKKYLFEFQAVFFFREKR